MKHNKVNWYMGETRHWANNQSNFCKGKHKKCKTNSTRKLKCMKWSINLFDQSSQKRTSPISRESRTRETPGSKSLSKSERPLKRLSNSWIVRMLTSRRNCAYCRRLILALSKAGGKRRPSIRRKSKSMKLRSRTSIQVQVRPFIMAMLKQNQSCSWKQQCKN